MSEQSPPFISSAEQLLKLLDEKSSSKTLEGQEGQDQEDQQPVHPHDPSLGNSCSCSLKRALGWMSISDAEWPQHLRAIATLRDPEIQEPTFEEYHPNATRYDSADAPVALAYFPTNRCTLFECQKCVHFALRYTEFGGYYVDPRGRLLDPHLIVK